MEYAIEYENLVDELVTNGQTQWHFNKVKDTANKYRLELTEDEFKGLFKLHASDKDVNWIMHKMSAHGLSFTDALISYITC